MEALGINLFNLILYSFFFLILYLVVRIFLIPKIETALEKRQKEIEHGLSLSKDIEVMKADIEVSRKKVLENAREEKKEILEEARKKAELQAEGLVQEAKEKAHKIITDAEKLIEQKEKMVELSAEGRVNQQVKDKIIQLAEAGKIKVNLDQIDSIL